MYELIAQGLAPEDRWRRRVPAETQIEIGRKTRPLNVSWDSKISRRHLLLELKDGKLLVEKIPEATNPVFHMGNEESSFTVLPGEHFVVGNTKFSFTNDQAFVTQDVPNPIRQKSFSAEFLRNVQYDDADRRIDVLNRLPEVIGSAGNEKDLMARLVNILLTGISTATAVAMVRQVKKNSEIEIIHWDRKLESQGDFQPSEGLIRQALRSNETILHVWDENALTNPDHKTSSNDFTIDYQNDWAFVCALGGKACQGFGIYVAGKNRGLVTPFDTDSAHSELQGDIKFTELVGSTLANVLQIQQLERQQTSLRSFFSPLVLEAFADQDPEVALAPRQCEVSVLFCDLRGFATTSEKMADNLLDLLSRVSDALGIMTRNILDLDGVVGDFHGDAAMGFWGWPIARDNTANSACKAALAIQHELAKIARDENHVLRDFQMGIGVATGNAVAGKIGTDDQVKVSAFGPVVNLAARLESITRRLGAAVLLDEATVDKLTPAHPFSIRRLVRVQPYGLQSPTTIYQLLGSHDNLDADYLTRFAAILSLVESGDWKNALTKLKTVEKPDPARDFLISFIQSHGNTAPDDWSGVISFETK